MADPLSLAASIIAVVGAADEVTRGLRRLKAAKDAPKGLQELLEDVEQLEMVLNCVKSTVLGSGSPPIELAKMTREAGSKLLELRSLIEYGLTKAGVSDKVDRWQWLRKGNEVERLRKQLSTIRLNLVALTSSANFGALQRVSIVTQDLSSEQQRLNAQVTSVLPRQEALLSHLCQRIEESQATQAAMMRLLGDFRQTDVHVASDRAVALSGSLGSTAITPIVARPRMRSKSEFHIQSLQIQSACPITCKCNCHRSWRVYSPWKLRKLFGNSMIECAELPFFKPACSLRSCKGKRSTFINIMFFLPTMIAARMISLWLTSSPLYGPELLLRVPRVVRTDTPAHDAICSGDLDAVKRSIFAGDYKPWDVDSTGQPLILVALDFGSFTTALYLAQVAADNYDCLGRTCWIGWYDVFGWKRDGFTLPIPHFTEGIAMTRLIFRLRLDNGDSRSLLDIDSVPGVDWNELFNKIGFSELHKIVYGSSSRRLGAEIEARPEDLDKCDINGLTALWHACWLGNSDYIQILLRYGADVNNGSIQPICVAIWRRNYGIVEQLLKAGALMSDQSIVCLYNILMFRPSRRKHVEELLAIDRAMFGRFLDINYRYSSWASFTPLIALLWWESSHSIPRKRQLLELEADTEGYALWGATPLHHAIIAGNAECCKMLGRAGANVNVRDHTGGTILATAIRTATHPDVIQAVSELDLSEIQLDAKITAGYTAFELFKIRARVSRKDPNTFTVPHPPSVYYLFRWYFTGHNGEANFINCPVRDIDKELQILSSFQTLLQQIQETQGIPIEKRYPLLSLTRDSLRPHHDEDKLLEPATPIIPGAWPEE